MEYFNRIKKREIDPKRRNVLQNLIKGALEEREEQHLAAQHDSHVGTSSKPMDDIERCNVTDREHSVFEVEKNMNRKQLADIKSKELKHGSEKKMIINNNKTIFDQNDINKCIEELELAREIMHIISEKYIISSKYRQEVFDNVGKYLMRFEEEKYENTKQEYEEKKRSNGLHFIKSNINTAYNKRVATGKGARNLWKSLANEWCEYDQKEFRNEIKLSKAGEKEKIPYPQWNNIEDGGAYLASLENMQPDGQLQRIIGLKGRDEGVEETLPSQLTDKQIQEAIKAVESTFDILKGKYRDAKEKATMLIKLDKKQAFRGKPGAWANAAREVRIGHDGKLDRAPLYAEVELRDLALGKARQTYLLLRELQSEIQKTSADPSQETSAGLVAELRKRVFDHCQLSVREWHEKYCEAVDTTAKDFKVVEYAYDIFQDALRPFKLEDNSRPFKLEDDVTIMSVLPEDTERIAVEIIEQIHIKSVLEQYGKLIKTMEQFKPENSIQLVLVRSKSGVVSSFYEKEHAKIVNEIEEEIKKREEEVKIPEEEIKKREEEVKIPEEDRKVKLINFESNALKISKEDFKEKYLKKLLNAEKNAQEEIKKLRGLILKTAYRYGDLASNYVGNPFRDSEEEEDSDSSESN